MTEKNMSIGIFPVVIFIGFIFCHIMLAAMSVSIEHSLANAIVYGVVLGLGFVYPIIARAIANGEITLLKGLRRIETKTVSTYTGTTPGADFKRNIQEVRNIVIINSGGIIVGSVVLGVVMSIALALSHGYA